MTGNSVLDLVPAELRESVTRDAERRLVRVGEVIERAGEAARHVWFPQAGVYSMLQAGADGTNIEVATIGNENFIGLSVFLGTPVNPAEVVNQIPGYALRIRRQPFERLLHDAAPLRAAMAAATQALLKQIAQQSACNRLHPIDQRCARWLLMTHDRVDEDSFPLTQEFLAQMLGVRRATVTTAAGMLQQAGFIQYRRGQITVLDRAGLEAASCECYGQIIREYQMLLKR